MAQMDVPRMVILVLLQLCTLTIAQPGFLYNFCLYGKGNYTANSTYEANLNSVLLSLVTDNNSSESNNGFYSFSAGENSEKATTIGLCRGDVKPEECRSCLNDSIHKLPDVCPYQMEAIGWYDYCMLRYSNRSIVGTMEDQPVFYMWNVNNVTDAEEFNTVLSGLLGRLQKRAASGGSKFATGDAAYLVFQRIYALVQCTPDLTEMECDYCLGGAIADIPGCCDRKQGGRVIRPSCNLRYEISRFYDPAADAPAPSPSLGPPAPPPVSHPQSNNTPSTKGKESITSQTVIIIIVSTIVPLVLIIISICIFLRMRKRREKVQTVCEDVDEIRSVDSLQYNFDTIRVGTNDFCDANKLGQGGFGVVYKGKLPNGQDIAVKRLSKDSGQGDVEFKNEVLLVAKLQHRNLVRLVGFCLEGMEKLLIYEFLPNGSLDHFIFDRVKRASLNWKRRFKIIEGVARGILYLHEDSRLRIIHRDLKASNILLDAETNAKISDFGMARLFGLDQTHSETSKIVGTYGYMAPEYAMYGNFSIKSDVFSFGVLVLEIVSGQKNTSFHNGENIEDLLCYAWKSWREGTAQNLIDPVMRDGSRNEMMRCIHVGLLCAQENLTARPTMASVVLMLSSGSVTLPLPSQPAFFYTSNSNRDSDKSSSQESNQYNRKTNEYSANEYSITELYPR